MSPTTVQLVNQLTLPRELWLVCEFIDYYTCIVHMRDLLLHLLCYPELSIDYFLECLRVVLAKEALLSICIHSHAFANMPFDL